MHKNPIVMIVDDEEAILRLMEAVLSPSGYEVVLFRNGWSALEKIMEKSPDILLVDAMMPGMNGFEIASRLKNDPETKSIPIVMVSALKDSVDRIRAIEAGVDDFLTKPFDAVELKARVCSLLKVKAYYDQMRDYQTELETEVARRTSQLTLALKGAKAASLETIYCLTRASENKDEETGEHIKRMSRYAAILAQKMGFDEEYVERILYAATMHDIGKIGIPDNIILKPGKLNEAEWLVMKQHPLIGSYILEGSDADFIKLGREIALTHHEKWDGSGYPKGLKGAEIPVAGQIAGIADVFDALTSKRPYKEPLSSEKSFVIIDESRNTHFDPRIIDAFIAVKDDILLIMSKNDYKDGDIVKMDVKV